MKDQSAIFYRQLDVETLPCFNLIPHIRPPRPDQDNQHGNQKSVKNPVCRCFANCSAGYFVSKLTNQILRYSTKPVPINQQSINEFIHCVAPLFNVFEIKKSELNKYSMAKNNIIEQLFANWRYSIWLMNYARFYLGFIDALRHCRITEKLRDYRMVTEFYRPEKAQNRTGFWQVSAGNTDQKRRSAQYA